MEANANVYNILIAVLSFTAMTFRGMKSDSISYLPKQRGKVYLFPLFSSHPEDSCGTRPPAVPQIFLKMRLRIVVKDLNHTSCQSQNFEHVSHSQFVCGKSYYSCSNGLSLIIHKDASVPFKFDCSAVFPCPLFSGLNNYSLLNLYANKNTSCWQILKASHLLSAQNQLFIPDLLVNPMYEAMI